MSRCSPSLLHFDSWSQRGRHLHTWRVAGDIKSVRDCFYGRVFHLHSSCALQLEAVYRHHRAHCRHRSRHPPIAHSPLGRYPFASLLYFLYFSPSKKHDLVLCARVHALKRPRGPLIYDQGVFFQSPRLLLSLCYAIASILRKSMSSG